jgi:precorrin-6x reductase
MRVLIFGGTTEGRRLAHDLAARGASVTVSVATEYGKETQGDEDGVTVLSGRLDSEQMKALIARFPLVIDATHPYAKEATANIRAAAHAVGVSLFRLLREESALSDNCVTVGSAEEAASYLAAQEGNILLTTGAKELSVFAPLGGERLYPRVLPMADSLAACEAAEIPRRNIIAMQGPFGPELNCALIRQFSIAFLVTKDGGKAGGFGEKVAAARETGISLVVIRRPEDHGKSYSEVLHACEEMVQCDR